jgi:hypothetical protein
VRAFHVVVDEVYASRQVSSSLGAVGTG